MPHRFYYGLGLLLYGCMLQFTALKSREKKATGFPFWLRVAANATSEASVSTSKGIVSSIAVTTASSIVFLRLSNASTAGGGKGNVLQEAIGLIRSENFGIHCE